MVGCCLLLPVFFAIYGKVTTHWPPPYEARLAGAGYRTRLSKMNADVWDFAQRFSGRVFGLAGLIGIPVVIALMLPVLGRSQDVIGIYGVIVMVVAWTCVIASPVMMTQSALRRAFTPEGVARS